MNGRESMRQAGARRTDNLPHQTIEDYAREKQEEIFALLVNNGLTPEEISHLTGKKLPRSVRPAKQ